MALAPTTCRATSRRALSSSLAGQATRASGELRARPVAALLPLPSSFSNSNSNSNSRLNRQQLPRHQAVQICARRNHRQIAEEAFTSRNLQRREAHRTGRLAAVRARVGLTSLLMPCNRAKAPQIRTISKSSFECGHLCSEKNKMASSFPFCR